MPAPGPLRGLSRVALAACGGALYFLGYLGFGAWPLLGVFLIPLWWALEGTESPGEAALLGLVFGGVAYAGGFPWLWRLVEIFLAGDELLGAMLWVAYGIWFAAGFGVATILAYAIRRRGWPFAVAGVAPLLMVEWQHPQIFPVHAGAGLADVTPLVQIADLGGPLLLTALVGVMNAAGFETLAWLGGMRRRPIATVIGALALLTAAVVYGRLRVADLEERVVAAPVLRVGIVQANLGILEKSADARGAQRAHLEASRTLLESGPLDLVVWPETAVPRALRGPLPLSGSPIRRDLDVPLLFGGTLIEVANGRRAQANASLLVGTDGMIQEAYRKNLLIPLAESVPLGGLLPGLESRLPHAQAFRAGHETNALTLGAWRIATPICYEAVRPAFVRRMVETSRANLLITLANDAWFGDSQEPWLHLQLARLRAVEQRRYLVRATNSGISAIVDPMGRILVRTSLLSRETLRGEVRLLEGGTPYARLGDWPGWVGAALVAIALAWRRPRRPSSRRASSRATKAMTTWSSEPISKPASPPS